MGQSHEYVIPGLVQTDNLENRFDKYRQCGCSGTYPISVRNIEKRFRLDNARKLIKSQTKQNPVKLYTLCSVIIEIE